MRTRIVVFKHSADAERDRILFGIQEGTLLHDLTVSSLTALGESNGWTRHEKFDWAVGDVGRKCALFEAPPDWAAPAFTGIEPPATNQQTLTWLSFPEAARLLPGGDDRRFLQLAVQYVAAGGVDDSVLATDYDKEFLETMKRELERRNPGDFPFRKDE